MATIRQAILPACWGPTLRARHQDSPQRRTRAPGLLLTAGLVGLATGTCYPIPLFARGANQDPGQTPDSGSGSGMRAIDLPAASLGPSIEQLARLYDAAIGTSGQWPAIPVPALHGRMTLAEALTRLLAGSRWHARQLGAGTWRIEPARVAAAVPAPMPAFAGAPPPTIAASSIIVTAGKRPMSLQALAMSAEVVVFGNHAALSPAADSTTIAALVPGLTVGGSGSGQTRLFLQGISDSAFNGTAPSTIAVVLDNARVSYAGADPEIRLVDIERVEVLEGPQGTLYGAGTLGGIYHVVTRRAALDLAEADGVAWTGTTAHARISGGGSLVANLPLLTDRIAVRGLVYAEHAAGWIADTGLRPGNATDIRGTRLAGAIAVAPDWRLDATLFSQRIASADSGYVFAADTLVRPRLAAEPTTARFNHAALDLGGRLGTNDVTVSLSHSWQDHDQQYDARIGASPFGLPDPAVFDETTHETLWDAEARMSGQVGPLAWLAGGSWFHARLARVHALTGRRHETKALDTISRDANETAAFTNLALALPHHVQAEVGLRGFLAGLDEVWSNAAAIGVNAPLPLRQRNRALAPSAALTWRPTSRTRFWLRYATGFRLGSLPPSGFGTEPPINGDRITSIELGWRQQLGSHGEWRLSAHDSHWTDMVADTLLPDHIIATANAGVARVVGGEARLHLMPGPHWVIDASADSEFAHLATNTIGHVLDDTRLPVVPAYTVHLAVHRLARLFKAEGDFGLGLSQIGPGRLSFDPILDRRIPPRFETRLSGQLRWQRMTLGLSAENLLDTHTDTYAFGNPLRVMNQPQFVPMRPRTILLSLGISR